MPRLALSIDVEDWFCVRNMGAHIPYYAWDQQEFRIRQGMDFLLEALGQRNISATFFILGWIAERCPALVAEIHSAGHEIASHGYNHQPLDTLSAESFEADLVASLDVLAALTGSRVKGYRAPSFSITRRTFWALEILEKHGLLYDSSIYPVRHPDYGIPGFPTRVTRISRLVEVPLSKVSAYGVNIPISGGGYFRLYPYALTRTLLRRALEQGDAVLYFHPWEFDADQPRVALPRFKRFRHYVGLRNNRAKFERLLEDFEFCRMDDLVRESELEMELRHGYV